ncbi:hypothetical protein CVT24_012746 [Panaeolus cyanescens]|uniref:Uncharacterized protein n=1 Tax=Panaeolus cyanescens TaxID=181874 RepID=A0A409YJL7_9AGAR|nr:hypothetical protein CVT24_012746 [Panaeolus cyanescens]
MDPLTYSAQNANAANPFFDTNSTAGLREGQVQVSSMRPAPRILLCFIDASGATQVAHYALVPLPRTYEDTISIAFDAFQSQLANSKALTQPNVEFSLMIKCVLRSGDPSMGSIWADIHPRNQWSCIVRDGDEILICVKMPQVQASAPKAISDHRLKPVPDSYAGPKLVFCHRPYGSAGYMYHTVALQFVQSFEDLKEVAHAIFQGQRKPFQSTSGWTVNNVRLYFNVTSRQKSGNALAQTEINNVNWPGMRNQGMINTSKPVEVEVIYEFR